MNQQKTGEFLKRLRKEKGLTQEQLAERFYVSTRTISRWETGSNLPDVGMLVDLADFYDVDIREIIDGERKGENMDRETRDTLKKVAAYATENKKKTQFKAVYFALGMSLLVILTMVLFMWETKGLLYGIVPEEVCKMILSVVVMVAGGLLISYLRVFWATEKPSYEPERTVKAAVIAREIKEGTNKSGRSMMGFSFLITFRTEDGALLELYAYEVEYGGLREGMEGTLTYQGRYFVAFEETA